MKLIVRLFTILLISGLMAVTVNAQTDSLLSFDDVEFTEITEEQPIEKKDNSIKSSDKETSEVANSILTDENETDKSSLWTIFYSRLYWWICRFDYALYFSDAAFDSQFLYQKRIF